MSTEVTRGECGSDDETKSAVAMDLLRDHVPLSLLFDLVEGEALDSTAIADVEGGNASWLHPA